MAESEQPSRSSEAAWKEYTALIDLFKFYVNMAYTVSGGYVAVTAAVIAYIGKNELPRIALIFPAIFGFGLVPIFLLGIGHLRDLEAQFDRSEPRKPGTLSWELGLKCPPHVQFLQQFLFIAALCFLGASVLLVIAYAYPESVGLKMPSPAK